MYPLHADQWKGMQMEADRKSSLSEGKRECGGGHNGIHRVLQKIKAEQVKRTEAEIRDEIAKKTFFMDGKNQWWYNEP